MIDASCHCKQNGKYNLAFSLCADNGANTLRQHKLKQTAGLVIRQERFGTKRSSRLGRRRKMRKQAGVGGGLEGQHGAEELN